QFKIPKIPEMTVRRLSVYTRCLLQLEEDGVKTISSQELAERFSLNSAQVRKDLAYFGEFGVRGIGYYVSGLKAELQKILGLDREWQGALGGFCDVGLGVVSYTRVWDLVIWDRRPFTTRDSRVRDSASPRSSTMIRARGASLSTACPSSRFA